VARGGAATGDEPAGRFRAERQRFRDFINADGSSGFKAEPGRYHLYLAYSCPWAHRTLIFRVLKKLEGAITASYALPGIIKDQGWIYENNPAYPDSTADAVNGFHYLHEAYTASDPHYTGKVTVPTLWDKKTKRIVNNESSEIIRMLNSSSRMSPATTSISIRRPCDPRSTASTSRSTRTSTTASIAAVREFAGSV
jgi:putative glutathione S-transferase